MTGKLFTSRLSGIRSRIRDKNLEDVERDLAILEKQTDIEKFPASKVKIELTRVTFYEAVGGREQEIIALLQATWNKYFDPSTIGKDLFGQLKVKCQEYGIIKSKGGIIKTPPATASTSAGAPVASPARPRGAQVPPIVGNMQEDVFQDKLEKLRQRIAEGERQKVITDLNALNGESMASQNPTRSVEISLTSVLLKEQQGDAEGARELLQTACDLLNPKKIVSASVFDRLAGKCRDYGVNKPSPKSREGFVAEPKRGR